MQVVSTAIHHRSRERVRDLGEVFTPEAYIEDMLDLLGRKEHKIWANEDISFFEPCCGHGNIVVSILRRRLKALHKKAKVRQIKSPELWAVANTINTLWAIDIDTANVEETKERVFTEILSFLKRESGKSALVLASRHHDFIAHILCAIHWHISENETLSALSQSQDAKENANLTKAGGKWFKGHGHHQLNFDLTWVNYYKQCKSENTIPLELERANQFVKGIISGRIRVSKDYNFARVIF